MNIIVTYDSKTNTYKIDNGSWQEAWDLVNNSRINNFGFNKVGNQINIESAFTITSIMSISYLFPNSITLNDNSAIFFDDDMASFYLIDQFVFKIEYNDVDNFECNNILGDGVNSFDFASDGVIYGTNSGDISLLPQSIDFECCSALGYTFNPDDAKCYWSQPCVIDDYIKILINPEGNDGVIYDINETDRCKLDISFDWLIEYNCNNLLNCAGDGSILNILSAMTLNVSLERIVEANQNNLLPNNGQSFSIPYISESVYKSKIFDGKDILDYFSTQNSGITLIGDNCDVVNDKLELELINVYSGFTSQTLFSNWLNFKTSIVDPTTLELIKNEKIKLALEILNAPCDVSILIDNVKLDKSCEVIDIETTFITTCPSFELERVVDNKKSWVSNTELVEREFDLKKRETDYYINHHKLGINSKEVDLNISPSRAIETDVMNMILNNSCILPTIIIDNDLLTSNFNDEIFTLEEFTRIITSELIDAKSRQTIRDYPLLRMIYENYLNSIESCGFSTNSFNYNDMDSFISLIGNYWVELIEQVIPSTTIWGSTYKYNNTLFDNNKFKYRKSSLQTCEPNDTLPIVGLENQIEVIKTLTTVDDNGKLITTEEVCNGVYINNINDGSEFIGSVSVIGNSSFKNVGDVIIINELLGNSN